MAELNPPRKRSADHAVGDGGLRLIGCRARGTKGSDLCIKARIRGKAALLERTNALELLSCLPLLCGSGSTLGLLFAVRHRRDPMALSHISTHGAIQADLPLRAKRDVDHQFLVDCLSIRLLALQHEHAGYWTHRDHRAIPSTP